MLGIGKVPGGLSDPPAGGDERPGGHFAYPVLCEVASVSERLKRTRDLSRARYAEKERAARAISA